VADQPLVKDMALAITAAFVVPPGAVLRFWHRVATEEHFDGGVLEYSIDGGATWQDILEEAGDIDDVGFSVPADPDRFLEGGYDHSLSACCDNPLPHRAAWSGESGGWDRVVADLADFAGATVRFRWRFGADDRIGREGWWVDDVELAGTPGPCVPTGIFADGFEGGGVGAWSAAAP
jgi:hypothetical protein